MDIKKFHIRKRFNMKEIKDYEKRIIELEELAKRLVFENKRLVRELSEVKNYILILDRGDYEAKG